MPGSVAYTHGTRILAQRLRHPADRQAQRGQVEAARAAGHGPEDVTQQAAGGRGTHRVAQFPAEGRVLVSGERRAEAPLGDRTRRGEDTLDRRHGGPAAVTPHLGPGTGTRTGTRTGIGTRTGVGPRRLLRPTAPRPASPPEQAHHLPRLT
ncbi:hypothetical protein ABZY36_05310 [Streptomyces sp. NPDC006627]|uniref:hypothetical protein n=1 Tax=Streptomyces sp. NPDC006627 TaxID=3154679 RepID=UPI0033ABEC0D